MEGSTLATVLHFCANIQDFPYRPNRAYNELDKAIGRRVGTAIASSAERRALSGRLRSDGGGLPGRQDHRQGRYGVDPPRGAHVRRRRVDRAAWVHRDAGRGPDEGAGVRGRVRQSSHRQRIHVKAPSPRKRMRPRAPQSSQVCSEAITVASVSAVVNGHL